MYDLFLKRYLQRFWNTTQFNILKGNNLDLHIFPPTSSWYHSSQTRYYVNVCIDLHKTVNLIVIVLISPYDQHFIDDSYCTINDLFTCLILIYYSAHARPWPITLSNYIFSSINNIFNSIRLLNVVISFWRVTGRQCFLSSRLPGRLLVWCSWTWCNDFITLTNGIHLLSFFTLLFMLLAPLRHGCLNETELASIFAMLRKEDAKKIQKINKLGHAYAAFSNNALQINAHLHFKCSHIRREDNLLIWLVCYEIKK